MPINNAGRPAQEMRYGLDVRGVRYPGIVNSDALPGGGTTDYVVAIFHEAIRQRQCKCYVREDTVLPMIFIPDCIKVAIDLLDANPQALSRRNGFNVTAMSFSAGELAGAIRKQLPDFVCRFEPDDRQAIAESWPQSLDDSVAREQWNWHPEFDMSAKTTDMLEKLAARHEQ